MGHAMVDAPVECHTLTLQKGELLEPRFTAGQRDGHMVDGHLTVGHTPGRWRWQGGHLHEREIVVFHLTLVVTPVKAHFGGIGTIGKRMEFSDLLKAHDLGPKCVRLFNITDIQHQMVDSHWSHRLAGWSRDVVTLCHWRLLPSLIELLMAMRIHEERDGAKQHADHACERAARFLGVHCTTVYRHM